MRVLITGATGFIGGAVARRLLADGHGVTALARNPRRADHLARLGAVVAPGDVTDAPSVERAAAGCDAVIHAAGVPRPAPVRVFEAVHIQGTINVTRAARAAGARRVVNIASQAVLFGGRDLINATDDHPYPVRFVDPYSRTKAQGEQAALGENGAGLEVTSLRPAVVWGPGDTTILPIMAKLTRSPLGIPLCGDGTAIEATTYIDHIVDATVRALAAPAAPGRTYLIVDGFRIAGRELLSRQMAAAGLKPRFTRVPRVIAENMGFVIDQVATLLGVTVPLAFFGARTAQTSRVFIATRAREDLGYEPTVTLDEGMARLAAWVREMGGVDKIA
jgi:nucleoside-diphosphate-sugar epimerase